MKYLFILGRNPELSIVELKSFFRKTGNEILDLHQRENAVLIELGKTLDADAIDFLGGILAIGIVICQTKDIDRKEIYSGEKNNFSYGIWDFSDETDSISDYLKKRFREEKLKASEKKIREDIVLQDGEKAQNFRSKLIEEEYFVFDNFFGKIIQRCNYSEIEKRDMEKPVRRESLSISPRLAKIMINLSEVKEGETLADSFCGIGVVLQEALLQDIKVIGVDKDKKAINGARENLKWFKFDEKDYRLINDDSSKVKIKEVQAIVSEPDFGETLKKIPTKEKAEAMIKRYEGIMIRVLRNMKKYVEGKIVFTSPLIRIGKIRIGSNFENLSDKTGLKVVEGFPIPEFRENQIVGREIVVFE